MECPRCRLLNPDSAEVCDCGYNFKTGNVQKSYSKATAPTSGVKGGSFAASSFRTLAGLGKGIATLGWIGIVVSVIAVFIGIVNLVSGKPDERITGLVTLGAGVAAALQTMLLVAAGQAILCFVAIEDNTRRTADCVSLLISESKRTLGQSASS